MTNNNVSTANKFKNATRILVMEKSLPSCTHPGMFVPVDHVGIPSLQGI